MLVVTAETEVSGLLVKALLVGTVYDRFLLHCTTMIQTSRGKERERERQSEILSLNILPGEIIIHLTFDLRNPKTVSVKKLKKILYKKLP